MKKLFALLKYAAIGIGTFLILLALLCVNDSPIMRVLYALFGLVFLSVALIPFARHLVFSLLSFFLAYLCAYNIPNNSGGALVFLFLIMACFLALGVYNGYRAYKTIRCSPLTSKLIQMLRKPADPIEPAVCTAPLESSPPQVQPATYEELSALKALKSRYQPPITQPDLRDSYAQYGGIEAELLTIDLMEGHDFEYWCANALQDMGFDNVEVTASSGDQGVDILATKDNIRYAIQCKRYSADLGNTPVQEVHAGKAIYNCDVSAVITNRYFTPGAKQLAEATRTRLWDRNWIMQYLQTKQDPAGSVLISHAYNDPPPIDAELDIDEMLPAAIDVVLETGQASVSVLQRRLNLGYARCARLVDEMEELGFVGPYQGSNPRQILLTRAEWETMRFGDL